VAAAQGDHVTGLDLVGSLLGARGRVLPMAVTPLDIAAEVRGADADYPDGVSVVRGQVQVATTQGEVLSVRLDPDNPTACPEAVQAIRDADWVVLGPGSWFSSVIPHLLVPGLRRALVETSARIVVTLNLEPQEGETDGYTPEDHLEVLVQQAPDLPVHAVVADTTAVPDKDTLAKLVESLGARLVWADVADPDAPAQHDPEKLARVHAELMRDVEEGL
jgi:uncharacterized cofD-like protein